MGRIIGARRALFTPLNRNVALKSQAMDDTSAWTVSNTTITANNTTAPDGTVTAEKIVANSNGGFGSYTIQSRNYPTGSWTLSFYAKPTGGAGQWLAASISDNAGGTHHFAWFDYLNNAVGATPDAGVTQSIETIDGAGGWNRYVMHYTTTSNVSTLLYMLVFADGSTATIASNEVYQWGTQFEAGGSATTYRATR